MFRRQIGDFLDAGKRVPRMRFNSDNLDIGLAFLQVAGHAGNGAAGAECGEK